MDDTIIGNDTDFLDDQELSQFLDDQEHQFEDENNISVNSDSSNEFGLGMTSQIYETPSFYHLKILKKYFGHSSFRPMQWQIISSLLKDKRDNCAVMSTGYGKSLCYQYPAIYSGGITLVVSPLISLMEDQVLSLKVSNISACLLGTAQKEKSKVLDQIFDKKYSIIYLTPEFVSGEYGSELLGRMKMKLDICLVAVDEAHCISSWGHDFRHQYRQLGRIRDILPGVPILAVTATATKKVESDIVRSLRMKNPQILHSGYDRPNLYLEVFHKSQQGPMDDFSKVMNNISNAWKFPGPTIVYCLTRKNTETIVELLKMKGINCAAYHAGKSIKERKEVHEKFMKDQLDVIVATCAFGMGIDKPDVRCVVHYGTPSTVEAYYQEIGRAGRDGELSKCVLFYNESDFRTHLMISDKNNYGNSKKDIKEDMSKNVRKYLCSTSCRRAFILSYFGENYTGKNDKCCDICCKKNSGIEQKYEGLDKNGDYDFTGDAEKLLKSMEALRGKFGLAVYVLFMRGSRSARLREEFKTHPLHGCGKDKSDNWWQSVAQMLIQENFIARQSCMMKGFKSYFFHLTEKGENFLKDLETKRDSVKLILTPPSDILEQLKPKAKILVPNYNSASNNLSSSKADLIQNVVLRNKQDEIDKKLYSLLMEKRNEIADVKDCMPYNVISIPDIKELIRCKPRALKDLDKCKLEMFSEFKIHQFGQELIDIIVNELGPGIDEKEHSKKSMVEALLMAPLLNKSNASAEVSYNLLKQGLTIQQISEQRGMAPSTIFSHLLDSMKKGLTIKLEQIGVDKFSCLIIVRGILETPGTLLTPIKEKCPDDITWDQIRAVLAYMKIRDHLEENQIDYDEFESFSYNSLKSEAGSLDLENIGCTQSQLKTNDIPSCSTAHSTTSNNFVNKTAKEDPELEEFLQLCENLIQEDELKLNQKSESTTNQLNSSQYVDNTNSIEERINKNPQQSMKYINNNDISESTLKDSKTNKNVNSNTSLYERILAREKQEFDELLELCDGMITSDENCDNLPETEIEKLQSTSIATSVKDMDINVDSRTNVRRNGDLVGGALGSPPFKIRKFM